MTLARIVGALKRGIAAVDRFTGEPVTYRRGNASAPIRATRGDKSATEDSTGKDTTVQSTRVDWIIQAEQLVLTTGAIEPMEGDLIVDESGIKHRVTKNPTDGKPARWMEHRVAMRVHTLVVEGE
jgi:hypothetical protein